MHHARLQIHNEKQAIKIRIFNLPLLPSSYTAREAKGFRNANNHPHRLAISALRNALLVRKSGTE
jgi:hypothetical protein